MTELVVRRFFFILLFGCSLTCLGPANGQHNATGIAPDEYYPLRVGFRGEAIRRVNENARRAAERTRHAGIVWGEDHSSNYNDAHGPWGFVENTIYAFQLGLDDTRSLVVAYDLICPLDEFAEQACVWHYRIADYPYSHQQVMEIADRVFDLPAATEWLNDNGLTYAAVSGRRAMSFGQEATLYNALSVDLEFRGAYSSECPEIIDALSSVELSPSSSAIDTMRPMRGPVILPRDDSVQRSFSPVARIWLEVAVGEYWPYSGRLRIDDNDARYISDIVDRLTLPAELCELSE